MIVPETHLQMTHFRRFPQDDTLSPELDLTSCARLLKNSSPTPKASMSLTMNIQQQKQTIGGKSRTSY